MCSYVPPFWIREAVVPGDGALLDFDIASCRPLRRSAFFQHHTSVGGRTPDAPPYLDTSCTSSIHPISSLSVKFTQSFFPGSRTSPPCSVLIPNSGRGTRRPAPK